MLDDNRLMVFKSNRVTRNVFENERRSPQISFEREYQDAYKNTNHLKRTIMISNSEFAAFVGLDLDAVKIKLMHESGEGWSPERTAAVETEYRRFLYLSKAYPDELKATTEDVDTFWHYHILDTMKYAADCEHLFGYFLHHFPYAGMRDEADWQTLQSVGMRTNMLYERTFGVRYPGAKVDGGSKPSCGVAERAGLCLEIQSTMQVGTAEATDQAAGAATVEAAYCYATVQASSVGTDQAAYCYATDRAQRAGADQAAYCYVTGHALRAGTDKAAYCYATGRLSRARTGQAAYCYATGQAPRANAAEAAYCYTIGRADKVKAEFGAQDGGVRRLLNSRGICLERPNLAC